MRTVLERDTYGRPTKIIGTLDEQTKKAYDMLPIAKIIRVKKSCYCGGCGSYVMQTWNVCPHCVSRLGRAE